MHRLCFLLAAVFAAGMWASTASAVTVIDHFNAPPGGWYGEIYGTAPMQLANQVSQSYGVAGDRSVTIDLLSGAGRVSVGVNSLNPSVAVLNSDAGCLPVYPFAYGTVPGHAIDLDLSHETKFEVSFQYADQKGKLKLTVGSGLNSSSFTADIPSVTGATPAVAVIDFSKFSGIDFHHLTSLKYEITGPESYDAKIDYFVATSIPAPMAAWAGGALLGLLGFAKVRRLKRS
jgi:hypothetical protein